MLSDLKSALRQLGKNPGFSVGVVLILAFAIGANTAEFSLTRAVLLKPLPWPQADRLVYVHNTAPTIGWPFGPVSIPDYLDRRNGTDCFTNAALYYGISFNLASGLSPEKVIGLRVTPSFFSTLGVSPWKGRTFIADEAVPGRDKVAIISYDLWQAYLGARESALGADLRLNGEIYRVVGIMPKGFLSPRLLWPSLGNLNIELWVPYAFTAEEMSNKGRGTWLSTMIARLRAGTTIEQAQQEVDLVQQLNAERRGVPFISRQAGGFGGIVVGYREQTTRNLRSALLILQAAASLMLLIACANVGNLLLVRAAARKKELAIRLALGCGRLRLARQFLTESVVLALVGGGLGILVGNWGLKLLGSLYRGLVQSGQSVSIDPAVLGFTLLLSLGSGLLFGLVLLVPLWQRDSCPGLRDGNGRGSAGPSTGRTRAVLIVAEVALAFLLLIAAGLTLKSFKKLENVRPGFSSDNVLTAQLSLPQAAYKKETAIGAFYAAALKLIRTLPGVKSAAAISYLPFSGGYITSDYSIEGEAQKSKNEPGQNARMETIDPEYFQTMQIPLLRGRTFSDGDTAKATPTVIIDEFLARRYFSGRDPIGRKLKIPINNYGGARIWTVIGVIGEVKTANLAEPVVKETLYFPLAQNPQLTMTLVVKTAADPHALVAPLRAAIQRIDPDLPAYDIQTMDQRLSDSLSGYRSPMILLILFGVTALGLAILGLYAVVAYAVSQRTREIGIRIALGAQNRAILALILGQGLRFTLLGVVLGLGLSFGLSRLLRSLLFGVSSNDPFIYFAVPALILTVALLACFLPARRASKVDPIVSLRSE